MFHRVIVLIASLTVALTLGYPGTGIGAPQKISRKAQETIIFSYQPMASPGGVIAAAMKRDRILRQSLARSGTTLRFIQSAKGKDTINQLKESQADFATIGDMPLLEATGSVSLKIFSQLKNNYSMVIGERGTTPQDLKGKRIGNAFATTGHFALLKFLASAGMTEKDVTLVSMDVNEMPEALRSGKIDAFAAWEPTASSTIAKNPDRYSAIGRQASTAYIVVTSSFAKQNPVVVSQVAASIARAMRWLQQSQKNLDRAAAWNRADIKELTGKEPTMTAQEIARYSHNDLSALHYSPKIPRRIVAATSLLGEELTFLKQVGKVAPHAQWAKISKGFDFSVMEHILNKPARYELNHFDYEE